MNKSSAMIPLPNPFSLETYCFQVIIIMTLLEAIPGVIQIFLNMLLQNPENINHCEKYLLCISL